MSRDISTTEKVRLSWVTELRRQGHRQCTGPYDSLNGVCAVILLSEMIERQTGERQLSPRAAAQDHAGLSDYQVHQVICMNDGRLGFPKSTFSEIADVVEGWFK